MQIWLSTYNMSAHNGITLLLAIFPTLYIPHLWFIFFASVILYFLGPLIYFFPFISPSGYHLFVSMSVMISVSLCLLIWFVFRFHLWMKLFNIPLFLADISFSIIPSQSMHIISDDKILFFCIGLPGDSDGKRICLQCRRLRFNLWVRKSPWRRK